MLSVISSVASRLRGPVAVLTLVACATNPATGHREFSLVSEGDEIALGQQGKQDVIASIGVVPDSALQRYVSSLGMSIARNSERPNLPWSYMVVDDAAVNAFALPGGPIFVTRGILGFMTSEAELMSVLGHETGHVTAKHSVRQISQQQLAQLAVGVGMVLSPTLQQFGDLFGAGLSLMFMKFSRGDETQADDLGFRYMTTAGYDPNGMVEMFRTLQRLGEGSEGRVPSWMSTHPDPGDRVQKTLQRIAATTLPTGLKSERDSYLQRIDGIVFGEDPRNGYFRDAAFFHPTLKFRVDFPSGWKTMNQASQVVGVSAQQDAVMVLSLAGRTTPAQALTTFLSQQGVSGQRSGTNALNGLPAALGAFSAQTEQGAVAGYVAFVELDGTTYRLLSYAPAQVAQGYAQAMQRAIGSFQRLTDPQALNVKPARVRIVRLQSAMTLTQFNSTYPSAVPIGNLAIINGVDAGVTLPAGTLVKRVVVE